MPQRWGVGSTQLHLDMERLALGVLLFDRIVLPTPSDLDEADRWDELGWDTEAQARRIVQLGEELVHFAPWDKKLRDDWRARCNHIKEIGEATRDLAYAATPLTIALTAWNDVMTSVGPDYRPTVRPIPVMWASSLRPIVRGPAKGTAVRDIGVEEKEPLSYQPPHLTRRSARCASAVCWNSLFATRRKTRLTLPWNIGIFPEFQASGRNRTDGRYLYSSPPAVPPRSSAR